MQSSPSSSMSMRQRQRQTSSSFGNNAIINFTAQQPTKVLLVTVACLAAGLLFMLLNALALGAKLKLPAPQQRQDNFLGENDALLETKYNPYAKNKIKNRLAIIIPYLPPSDGAPTFPPYFDLFAMSAAGSSADIDYLIFHCFIPTLLLPHPSTLPSNVKLIDLNVESSSTSEGERSECHMARLFTRVTDQRQKDQSMKTSLDKLIHTLSTQIINLPYILVEYKPAFGHIFAKYLQDYTHWGYSDLDVVFGDMSRWIDEDEWHDYDIVTYGFGDQDKLYLRGQFTFHRNDPKTINQLWRHCKYLSQMDVRYAHPKSLKLESAEGCYSQAVITRKDIKVKWAVKAFTDVGENSPIYTQGVYLSLGSTHSLTSSISYQPTSVLYTAATIESGKELLTLPHDWFTDKSKYPNYSKSIPIQKYVGDKTTVTTYRTLYEKGDLTAADVKCMYWAPKTYQMDICVVNGNVENDDVVTLEKGILYKQKFVQRENVFPTGVKSFPFFHFQEWKRIYRTTELLPSHNIRRSSATPGLIITKEGSIPLLSSQSTSATWNFRQRFDSSIWMNADTGSTATRLTSNIFCLSSAPKRHPVGATSCKVAASWPQPDVHHNTQFMTNITTVTMVRSPSQMSVPKVRGKVSDLKSATWWDEKYIDSNNDVTLTLTLQITSLHMEDDTLLRNLLAVADSNIYVWGSNQPCVLLIHVDSTFSFEPDRLDKVMQLIKDKFALTFSSSTSHLQNSLVAIIHTVEPKVSRKGLMNMATFAAPTRWIISGVEIERGLVLSKEASVYAMREAKVHAKLPGHVWVIPQFASLREDTRNSEILTPTPPDRLLYSSIGLDLLPSIRGKHTMVSNLSDYDCAKCKSIGTDDGTDEENATDGVDDAADHQRRRLTEVYSSSTEPTVENLIEDLWWDLSIAEVYGTPGGFNSDARTSLEAMAKIHDKIEVSLISLLDQKGGHLDYLRYFDKSVILMIDRLGPKKEMLTLDLAPEVEEFGGIRCFHLLRLAQLAALGYKVGVIPGVFAASYPNTRNAICTDKIQQNSPLQCDCELESDATTKEILLDEAKRPAKIAVMLQEQEYRLSIV